MQAQTDLQTKRKAKVAEYMQLRCKKDYDSNELVKFFQKDGQIVDHSGEGYKGEQKLREYYDNCKSRPAPHSMTEIKENKDGTFELEFSVTVLVATLTFNVCFHFVKDDLLFEKIVVKRVKKGMLW